MREEFCLEEFPENRREYEIAGKIECQPSQLSSMVFVPLFRLLKFLYGFSFRFRNSVAFCGFFTYFTSFKKIAGLSVCLSKI